MNSITVVATYYIRSVGVALLASGIAFILNKAMRKSAGQITDSLLSPVFEEGLKTFLALSFSASITIVHLAFGVFEALLDYQHGNAPKVAALLAILTHGIFGLVTVGVWQLANNIYGAVSASILIHMLWNTFVHDLVNSQ